MKKERQYEILENGMRRARPERFRSLRAARSWIERRGQEDQQAPSRWWHRLPLRKAPVAASTETEYTILHIPSRRVFPARQASYRSLRGQEAG